MPTNLDKYKADLDALIASGEKVRRSLLLEALGERFKKAILDHHEGDKEAADAAIKAIPNFKTAYQMWYSEARALVKQLLPDRLSDFVRHYEKPKGRKNVDFESYRIEDALQGLRTTRGGEVVANIEAAIPHLEQQLAIVLSVKRRFETSLFDISQLVQADLFDSELESSRELLKSKFTRAAGAIAGVVLEKHLAQACANHNVSISKKYPTIGDLNEALRSASVIDIPQWRFIQHLADIRNLCDHNKTAEPTKEQVTDLIDGVAKVSKTVY